MRKIIIEIEREKAEYIERLNFELGFAKDVIQRIIESHQNDPDVINSEAFKAYQKKRSRAGSGVQTGSSGNRKVVYTRNNKEA